MAALKKKTKLKALKPVRPNVGIEANYQAKLDALIEEMNRSVLHWVKAAYRKNEPVLAQDELPSTTLWKAMRKMTKQWQKRFDEAAPKAAKHFAKAAHLRADGAFEKILKDAGFSIKFQMTRAQRDLMNATVKEQVSLIRSIPQKYLTEVEGMVMRSVTAGHDLEVLAKGIQKQYGVTKKRAAFIARDQNNKATATTTRARQKELGINQAIWLHSHGGKKPRPTHLANNGKPYDVNKGWYDPDAHGKGKGAWIFPGELINCRCVSRSIVPGING